MIIAHRGGAKSFSSQENTINVFSLAIKHQIEMIEFDVRSTKDQQYVVFHNNHLGGIKLKDITYKQLQDLAKKQHFSIPLLEDVLKICDQKIGMDIELKEDGYVKEILDMLKKYAPNSTYIITSFKDSVIKQVKQLDNSAHTGLLIGLEHATFFQRLNEIFPFHRLLWTKANCIVPNYKLVTPWLRWICQLFHIPIYVWTVNEDMIYNKLIKNKVNAIITDYPKRYNGSYYK